jgi:uncharacterized spore protein YtfJ
MIIATVLICASFATGQNPPEKQPQASEVLPASDLADAFAQRLSNDLHVKTVVGEPIRIGSVTVIPILTIEIEFAGVGMAGPAGSAGAPQIPAPGVEGFYMSGEARPVGFVAITKTGTHLFTVAKVPAK